MSVIDFQMICQKDYFDNLNLILNYQKTKIDYHLANIKDDYIPLIFP